MEIIAFTSKNLKIIITRGWHNTRAISITITERDRASIEDL